MSLMATSSDRNLRSEAKTAPMRLQVECSFAAVRQSAERLRAYLAKQQVSERDLWACELAFVEGCNNAVQNTPPGRSDQKLLVEFSCESTHVELRINDHTLGFDLPDECRLPDPESENGRGIYLIHKLMDEVAYIRDSSSNCLVLKRARTGI